MKKYYKVVVLTEVEDKDWDCGCDETFSIFDAARKNGWPIFYKEINKAYYLKLKHKFFTEEGGI